MFTFCPCCLCGGGIKIKEECFVKKEMNRKKTLVVAIAICLLVNVVVAIVDQTNPGISGSARQRADVEQL